MVRGGPRTVDLGGPIELVGPAVGRRQWRHQEGTLGNLTTHPNHSHAICWPVISLKIVFRFQVAAASKAAILGANLQKCVQRVIMQSGGGSKNSQ